MSKYILPFTVKKLENVKFKHVKYQKLVQKINIYAVTC